MHMCEWWMSKRYLFTLKSLKYIHLQIQLSSLWNPIYLLHRSKSLSGRRHALAWRSWLLCLLSEHCVCWPGYVASRHVDYGSQYIRCLVYVFSRKAHVDHVMDMLTEVSSIFLILCSSVQWLLQNIIFFCMSLFAHLILCISTPAHRLTQHKLVMSSFVYFWPSTKQRGFWFRSILSVYMYELHCKWFSVDQTITFESLDIGISYLHIRSISGHWGQYRASSYMVIRSRSRS